MKSATVKLKFFPHRQILRRPIIGDMRHLISIRTRTIGVTNPTNIDFTENFVTTNTVYASIVTKQGDSLFDGTNLESHTDTLFFIRFISNLQYFSSDLTQEYWIEYNGNRYDIKTVESYDERQQFMLLRCTLRGASNIPVNSA